MKAADLFKNKDLLIDYVWGNLDEKTEKKLTQLLKVDMELSKLLADLTYLSTILPNEQLKLLLKRQKENILQRVKK